MIFTGAFSNTARLFANSESKCAFSLFDDVSFVVGRSRATALILSSSHKIKPRIDCLPQQTGIKIIPVYHLTRSFRIRHAVFNLVQLTGTTDYPVSELNFR